jgi:hypothetical protein
MLVATFETRVIVGVTRNHFVARETFEDAEITLAQTRLNIEAMPRGFGDTARGRTIDGLYGPKGPDLTAAAAYLRASTKRQ